MKGKSPETIVLRFVWLESLTQDYTNAEIGQIIRDLYHYASQRMQAQVVFIDYLQLLRQAGAKDRYTAVTQLSMDLHELAQTTGILVVALAQLNRNAAHAAPSTADLRESGQVEQDADAILLLSSDGERYQAILAKNKEGRVGEVPLTFDKTRQRFLAVTSELERR